MARVAPTTCPVAHIGVEGPGKGGCGGGLVGRIARRRGC